MDIVETRALADNRYRVTIAANEKVRKPPDLDLAGLSIENYAKNPVVMWAHDAVGRSPSGGLPIGRTLELNKTREGMLVADFEFLADDQFAQRVKNAWDKGFLQAASISWLPLESAPGEAGRGRDTLAELLEWSIVSVPADPDALRESQRRMMDAFLSGPPTPAPDEEGRGVRGLGAAIASLRRVVEELEASTGQTVLGADADDDAVGLSEIRELAGSLKSALLAPGEKPGDGEAG